MKDLNPSSNINADCPLNVYMALFGTLLLHDRCLRLINNHAYLCAAEI